MKKQNLVVETILKKKFTTELSGYNPTEVDEYLDKIIEDYQYFADQAIINEQKLIEKKAFINDLEEEIEKYKIEIQNLKGQLKESAKASNYELLQEIKKLKKG